MVLPSSKKASRVVGGHESNYNFENRNDDSGQCHRSRRIEESTTLFLLRDVVSDSPTYSISFELTPVALFRINLCAERGGEEGDVDELN